MSAVKSRRSPARLLLTGAFVASALLGPVVIGSVAFADTKPSAVPSQAAGTRTPSAAPADSRPAVSTAPSGVRTAAPAPARPTEDRSAATPAPAGAQVKDVPRGGAQAGDGGSAGSSTGMLVGGTGLAAAGAAGLGFVILRRRAGGQA